MGGRAARARVRSACAGLLAAGFLAATASGVSAAPVGRPGVAALSEVQVTTPGVSAILTTPWAAGASTAGVPVRAAIGRVVAPASVQTISAASTASAGSAAHLTPLAEKGASVPRGMSWLLLGGLLTVFVALVGLVFALMAPTYVSRRQRRVDSIEGYVSARPTREGERSAVTAISASLVSVGDKVMDSRASTPTTQRLIERADLPLRVGEWAVLRAVAVVVGVSGGIILMHAGPVSTFFGSVLGGLLGLLLPGFFLKFMASRRAKKFEAQLPDVLTLVASSLSTGFSLLQALDGVARDADDPSAKEFARALAETRIGADLNNSLDHLADRMDSKNMRWTGMAIDIQRQVGGNLAETLRNTAATLRDRQALSRHVKALAAEGKLSAYILIALPIGLFLYMLMANRPYVELLWTRVEGIGMLVAGLVSMAFGIFWMSKVIKVEV